MPGDEFVMGEHTAKIKALEQSLDRLENSLLEHRSEERETWKEFMKKLDEIKADIDNIDIWRARLMGMAAAITTILSLFWHMILSRIEK